MVLNRESAAFCVFTYFLRLVQLLLRLWGVFLGVFWTNFFKRQQTLDTRAGTQ